MRATDGFGFLALPQASTPNRNPAHRFCLDAVTFWRKAPAPRVASQRKSSTSPVSRRVRAQRRVRRTLP